jgi:hypothetical protein
MQTYAEGISEAVVDDCLEEDAPKPCIIKALITEQAKEAALAASVVVVATEPGPLGMLLASQNEGDPPFVQALVEGGHRHGR